MNEITEQIIEAARLARESLEALTDDAILNGDKPGLAIHKANLELAGLVIREWSRAELRIAIPQQENDPGNILFWPRMRLNAEWKLGSDPFNISPV